MILKLLLNTQVICKIVMKIFKKNNIGKKCKILIAFDDMIVDMIDNKKLNPVLTELFIRGRNLSISPLSITQSCQRRIQIFSKGVVLYVGHYSWPTNKILGFRWSQKAKTSFCQNISINIFKFSPFLYIMKAC